MPSGTINIAGKKINKNVVYVGAAATAGIVGYAWFTKGSQLVDSEGNVLEEGDLAEFEVTDSGDERIPTTGIPTPSSFGVPITTNADWSELAIERLINLSIDGGAVSSALGKFLDHKPLNKIEADLVRQAIRAAGNPPQGGPWQVIEEPAPPPAATPSILPAPIVKVARVTGSSITLTWDPVMGATTYKLTRVGGGRGVNRPGRTHTSTGLRRNTTYTFVVRAVDGSGKGGVANLVTARTAPR